MTIIFHRNKMDASDWFDARLALHKQGFKTDVLGRKTLEIALRGTKFETIIPLFSTHSLIAFGKFETTSLGVEPKKVKSLLKALKKTPGIVLLAAVMGDSRMMSASQLRDFADWGDKRVELASTLRQASGVNVSRTLSHHLSELSRILSQASNQT
jgi:ribosomal protein L10